MPSLLLCSHGPSMCGGPVQNPVQEYRHAATLEEEQVEFTNRHATAETVGSLETVGSFDGNLEDFTVLRYHAVRALCGVLMDRHTACRSPHRSVGLSVTATTETPLHC